jgi:hypothetical protein
MPSMVQAPRAGMTVTRAITPLFCWPATIATLPYRLLHNRLMVCRLHNRDIEGGGRIWGRD